MNTPSEKQMENETMGDANVLCQRGECPQFACRCVRETIDRLRAELQQAKDETARLIADEHEAGYTRAVAELRPALSAERERADQAEKGREIARRHAEEIRDERDKCMDGWTSERERADRAERQRDRYKDAMETADSLIADSVSLDEDTYAALHDAGVDHDDRLPVSDHIRLISDALTSEREKRIAAERAMEEHEAAICPEDVGCAEYVAALTSRAESAESDWQACESLNRALTDALRKVQARLCRVDCPIATLTLERDHTPLCAEIAALLDRTEGEER